MQTLTKLDFVITRDLSNLQAGAIVKAIDAFVNESHCKDDKDGLKTQTIENIIGTLAYNSPGRYFWMAEEDGNVVAYATTHITKDVDNTPCYYITQAWIDKKFRASGQARRWFEKLRKHAKDLNCRHIIIPSSRHTKPYLRWLGKAWHEYVTLLKEDI